MGRITAGVGLISGIDIQSIVDQLMELEARPRTLMADRQAEVDAQRTAVMDISALMLSLKLKALGLRTSNALASATATSSNESILTATAADGALPGTYQFNVARLVSSQQSLSAGYASSTSAVFSAGSITINSAQARLADDVRLELLNGQQGVRRGSIRITDRSGASAVIDLTSAVSIGDVLEAINSNQTVRVQATTSGGQIVLADQTGQAVSNLVVTEVGSGHTAADLGILKSVAADTLTGDDIVSVNADTTLAALNAGMGVRTVLGQNDFRITLQDGTLLDVNTDTATTLGDVVDAINNAVGNGGKLIASIDQATDGLKLSDTTVGGETLAVTALNSSGAAYDLGILGSDDDADGLLGGWALMAGLQEVLLSRLNGRAGVGRGTISITDRDGAASQIDLSAANTIQDVIDAINDPGVTADVTAALSDSGSGIVITDNTSGAGNLVIADVSGTLAADLKITVDAAVGQKASGDLNRQFLSEVTRLDDLRGGLGVSRGKFTITNSLGSAATVDLTQGNEQTLQDVIDEINSKGLLVTATINATGDGLLLTDTASGGGLLTVADVTGSSAADLGLAGSAAEATTYIDGTSEVTVSVTDADTLTTLVAKLNSAGAPLRAAILNDGTPLSPYRLSLAAARPGAAGALLVDGGETGLGLAELIRGQDAVLRVGGDGGSGGQALLITSHSNTVTGVIDKVTLDLKSADAGQTVTVTVASDPATVATSLNGMVTDINSVFTKIATYTKYDAEKQQGAVLQGDGTIISAQARIQGLLFRKFTDTGSRYETLSSIGFRYQNGQMSLDEEKFSAAFQEYPDDVRELLQDAEGGFLKALEDLMGGLAQTGTGSLYIQADRLERQSQMYDDRIAAMDKLLEAKRARLTNSFNAMEKALAQLQAQQTALTSLSQLVSNWQWLGGSSGG